MCSKLEQKKSQKMQLIFIVQLEGAMFALLAHTPTYITCEPRPHREFIVPVWAIYQTHLSANVNGFYTGRQVSTCQRLQLNSVIIDFQLSCASVCARKRERQGDTECPCGCVCVAFVILAILMSLKTISEKVANDVRAKMELEVFRVFMQFVAAA